MITERMKEMIESCGWDVEVYKYSSSGEYLWVSKYSNAGEDFSMVLKADDDDVFVDNLLDYSETFDPEEHAASWYGANNGEPQSLRVLLEDADDIKKDIKYLHGRCNELYLYEDLKLTINKEV